MHLQWRLLSQTLDSFLADRVAKASETSLEAKAGKLREGAWGLSAEHINLARGSDV